jgi:hypothetical protein
MIGKLQKEILGLEFLCNAFAINEIDHRRAFFVPSCLLTRNFAQKSMPKIGKMALGMVQFSNPNVIRNLRRTGSPGGDFSTNTPLSFLTTSAPD